MWVRIRRKEEKTRVALVNVRVLGGVLDPSDEQPAIEGIADRVVDVAGKGTRDFGKSCWGSGTEQARAS